jgi:glycogen debranching enzyme
MSTTARVPQSSIILHSGEVALVCGLDGQLDGEASHGLFAGDTRVLSTYRLGVSGQQWRPLVHTLAGHTTARWEYENPHIRDAHGDIPSGSLLLSLKREFSGVLHDELHLSTFLGRRVRLRLTLQLDGDFADIFHVHDQSLTPHLNVGRIATADGMLLTYAREGFRRALHVHVQTNGDPPVIMGTLVVCELDLPSGGEWSFRLVATPEIDGVLLRPAGVSLDGGQAYVSIPGIPAPVAMEALDILQCPFDQGCRDLRALAIPEPGHPPFVAAGVPWFLTLFGRDALMTTLMAGVDGTWMAEGALAALGARQATKRDDYHDAEPGKLVHEVRCGELSHARRVVQSPYYYGTHDAPTLYCLALWHTWRWTGNPRLLEEHLETARACMRWCEEYGDRDGDGLLEYKTRSSRGYRNQGWKDAGDAVVDARGRQARLPLAVVEMQGYLFAARLAMAELLDVVGEPEGGDRLRRAAEALRVLVEERYWLEDEGSYGFALDGRKRIVDGIASNAGHLLWSGLPHPDRAAQVARRLLASDMFSGWGLRTISARNPAYNPMSYQRGSVWPHDTALAAAGLARYGLRDEASVLLRAILDAASFFEDDRLPELFCGVERTHGLPVPYGKANSPQAWAAAVPLLATQVFLGLVPDAPQRRCFIAPWLPGWLPRLRLRGVAVGPDALNITIARRGDHAIVEELDSGQLEVVERMVEAPLWGAPIRSAVHVQE